MTATAHRHQLQVDGALCVPHPDELMIGGRWVTPSADERATVASPTTEEVVAEVAAPTVADADAALACAVEAHDGPWPTMTAQQRAEVCTRFCDLLEARFAELGDVWAGESGIPFGGFKKSGWGREAGPEGIREFTSTKQLLIG
jgi:betaine-aldehyde dehydrogenase